MRNQRTCGDTERGPLHDAGPLAVTESEAETLDEQRPAAAELPRARQRFAIASLALAAFALGLNTNVMGALLPFLPAELLPVDGGKTWLLAAAACGSAIGSLTVAPLTAWHGRRNVLVAGLAAFIAASLLHLATRSFWPFLTLRFVAGFAVGLAYAAASALAAEVAPYRRRGAAMGMFTAGMFSSIAIGMPASVALANVGHWDAVFVLQSVAAAIGAWWGWRALPPSVPIERRGSTFSTLGSAAVRAGLVATMLHVGSFFTTVQLATTWLDATGRVAKADQTWLWCGLGLASVVGSALFGGVSDRVGKRGFVLVTSIALVASFASLAFEPSGITLLVVGSLIAVIASSRTGPLQALVSGLVPAEQMSALMGLRGAIMQVGVVVFAMVAGPIERELGFRGVLLLAAAFQFVSFVAIRVWVKERT